MAAKRVIVAVFLAVTVLSLRCHAARNVFGGADLARTRSSQEPNDFEGVNQEHVVENKVPGTHPSTGNQNLLGEVDRLKLSISRLACSTHETLMDCEDIEDPDVYV